MSTTNKVSYEIPLEMAGLRIDKALAKLMPELSRSRLQQWIRDGKVMVDGRIPRPKEKVSGGEVVIVMVVHEEQVIDQGEDIALDILYEDDDLIVINKPAGLVMHPGAGVHNGTLLNALLFRAPELAKVPRAGIIHRLDKDTSGVLVVARNINSHKYLVEQLQAREIKREYQCIVQGDIISGSTIDEPIARHRQQRTKMAVVQGGRDAVTHYRVIKRYDKYTHAHITLETGRTHQIRVHMAHIRHPLVGDRQYGGRYQVPAGISEKLAGALRDFQRQALHAVRLSLLHPMSHEPMVWNSPLAQDMVDLLALFDGEF